MAFIGLGCTFWAAVFFLVTPTRYVEGTLLENTIESSYKTLDRILGELKYQKISYCIPPYPQDVYLPEHLKSLKETILFIPAEEGNEFPSIEEIIKGKFQIDKPKGILVNPPGMGLLERIEGKLRRDSSKIAVSELCAVLPQAIDNSFALAKEIILTQKENQVTLRINGSMFKELYNRETSPKSVYIVGCPIVSAVACALAKSSGKPVTIQKIRVSPEAEAIDVSYRIVEVGEKS